MSVLSYLHTEFCGVSPRKKQSGLAKVSSTYIRCLREPAPPSPCLHCQLSFLGSRSRATFSHRETYSSAFSYRIFRDTLDVSTDMDLTRNLFKYLSKLWEIVENRRAWLAAVHGVAKSDTT